MIAWLIDTLVATGVLMAVVLLLRRPVARAFGPGVAYALWALPLIRLILPPLMLPASFAPKVQLPDTVQDVLVIAAPRVATGSAAHSGWSLADWSIAVWLCGAVALLIWRAWSYAAMRRRLLEHARPMGEAGKIRIIETRAVTAPVAFGVFDKVVALPWGFMASPDRLSRNFALEHEFEHHAGRDLAANFVFQPLLALHWFNPLGWLAWRAMRRDQEAACDARVMAGRGSFAREAYGRLIAGYAAGPRLALAAPMACPVLGEKSIVQRLKCLAQPEISARRRAAGGVLLAASALALPLTATISYAEADFAPMAPVAAKNATGGKRFVIVDDTNGVEIAGNGLHARVVERDGATFLLKTPAALGEAAAQARVDSALTSMSKADRWADEWAPAPPAPPAPAAEPAPPAPPMPPPMVPVGLNVSAHGYDARHYGEMDVSAGDDCSNEVDAMVEQAIAGRDAHRARARFAQCTRRAANLQAIEGLRDAREEIEADDSMPHSIRRQIIENFDRQIASLSRRG